MSLALTDKVLTVEQAAGFLQVRPDTVRAWARARRIPGKKIGKLWRFLPELLAEVGRPIFPPKRTRKKPGKSDAYYLRSRKRSAKRHASLRLATPCWADREAIQALYRQAKEATKDSGVPHHVDHILPLHGSTVCGLHVECNLRILVGVDNARKGNRL